MNSQEASQTSYQVIALIPHPIVSELSKLLIRKKCSLRLYSPHFLRQDA